MHPKAKGAAVVTGLGFFFGWVMLNTGKAQAATRPPAPDPDDPATRNRKAAKASKSEGKGKMPNDARNAAILPLAVKYAKVFGVPSSLLMALCAIESSYVPTVSNTGPVAMANGRGGAWGLTQILLATATAATKSNPKMAAKYWPKFDGTGESLKNAETNIAMAAFLLAALWRRFKGKPGNWFVTGLSWNQGAGGVDKFLAKGGGQLDPAVMTKGAKEYYARLKNQFATNEAVLLLAQDEQRSGAFAYA